MLSAVPANREPVSRIKRILAQDPDINACSNPAAFLVTLSTELFIQHLAASAHSVVRAERKPRKNIQYKDLANAVARSDNLEFLSDVVPRTVPFKEVKAKKARKAADEKDERGQAKLSNGEGKRTVEVLQNYLVNKETPAESEAAKPEEQMQTENEGAETSRNGQHEPNGNADINGDVEMS